MTYPRICISSGHSTKCQGAVGILNEVEEATRVTEHLADELRARGVDVETFSDTKSTNQSDNLNAIVNWHNSRGAHDLDISVHFNAYVETTKPMGCEVLWITQQQLATDLSAAIAKSSGLINRGAKKRTDLFFLNNTAEPAVLLEVAFVDSSADANIYNGTFDEICSALADVLGGKEQGATAPPEKPEPPVEAVAAKVDIQIAVTGNVEVTINGEQVEIAGHGRNPFA